jgi:hypothetical protein
MIDALNELKLSRALVLDALRALQPRLDRYTVINEKHWRSDIEGILDDVPITFA